MTPRDRVRPVRLSASGWLGAGIIGFWALAALFAPWLSPLDPLQGFEPFLGPGFAHWLGTDHLGRDVVARLVHGARPVLLWAPAASALALVTGVGLGLIAAWRGGWVDRLLLRIGDVLIGFPVVLLYVFLIGSLGATGLNILIVVGLVAAPGFLRLTRQLSREVISRPFIDAARLRGEGLAWILVIEVLPNIWRPLVAEGCLRLGYTVVGIGVLGFLGLGLPPPNPDWGAMAAEARSAGLTRPDLMLYPCAALFSFVLGCNLLAEGWRRTC
ncbi:MAG: ABC transporter permease [Magnetovibrionaceae bacterium]